MADTVRPSTGPHISATQEKSASMASMGKGLAGMAAVALTIVGLSGIIPGVLVSWACIAVGLALAFEGGAISARYSALIRAGHSKSDKGVRTMGSSLLFIAGVVGIGLGAASVFGIIPSILVPVAAIVFGVALFVASGVNQRLSALEASRPIEGGMQIRDSNLTSAGIQMMVGVASVTLGILALFGLSPLTLSLVAVLIIGSANLLTGTIISGRTAGMSR